MLWRWLMFNTHFSWQHQKGTRQVKQIYLACFEASSELALKLLSMQLPMLVCDFVTPITEHGRSIYLCVRLTPHIQSYWSEKWSPSLTKQLRWHFVTLKMLFFWGWYKVIEMVRASLCEYTCSHIHKLSDPCSWHLNIWSSVTIYFVTYSLEGNLYIRVRALAYPRD